LRFIYNCFGGSHSSVTAAGIHLGLLPDTRVASKEELLSLPYYDAQVSRDHGRIRFMGFDESGCEVYIASKKNMEAGYERSMRAFWDLVDGNQDKVAFIDTMPYVNIFMMIGGFMSRRCGLNRLGRAIVLFGTRQSYYKFIHLVNLVKSRLKCDAPEDSSQ